VTSVYDSDRLAAAYAVDRPPVHEHILRSARLSGQADLALDVGCGAGLSTAALAPLARRAIGLEPVPAMLAHRAAIAPGAGFVIGRAERLPFPARDRDRRQPGRGRPRLGPVQRSSRSSPTAR